MGIARLSAPAAAAVLLAACVSNPYEAGFARCDQQAGACYQSCYELSETPDPYAACQARCEASINQCFASVYDAEEIRQSRTFAYRPAPWYGRYGYWHPSQGYFFGYNYSGDRRYAPRYGGGYRYDDWYYYNQPYHHRRNKRHRDSVKSPPPSVSPPPVAPMPPRAAPPQTRPPNPMTQRTRPASPRTREDTRNLEDY